jgi:hypothetical protein
MNPGKQPLIVINQEFATTVAQVTAILKSDGYFVQQSFNLRTAMNSKSGCTCNREPCNCQMVVLLVYAQEGPPATLVFNGDQSQTQISLVTGASQLAHPELIEKLTYFLPNTIFSNNPITP